MVFRFVPLLLITPLLMSSAACADTQEFTSAAPLPGRVDAPAAQPEGGASGIRSCDTAHDANNCGACGHRCLGGTCLSGQCQPVELARGLSPLALAVAGDDLYFLAVNAPGATGPDSIRRLPTRGGLLATVTTLPGASFGSLVLRGGYLYAAYQGKDPGTSVIGRLPVGGDAIASVVTRPAVACQPAMFTVTSTSIVFTCDRDVPGLFACPLTGCASEPRSLDQTLTLWRSRRALVDIGDAVLVASDDAADLRRVPVDGSGGCDVPMAAAADLEAGIAYDGKSAFVARSGELVKVAPVCGAGQSTVVVKSRRVERPKLALNDDDVLWGEQNLFAGSIMRCSKTGCEQPEVIATGQGFVMDVVATNDAIYWVTAPRIGSSPVPGTIMKLALPPRPTAGLPLQRKQP